MSHKIYCTTCILYYLYLSSWSAVVEHLPELTLLFCTCQALLILYLFNRCMFRGTEYHLVLLVCHLMCHSMFRLILFSYITYTIYSYLYIVLFNGWWGGFTLLFIGHTFGGRCGGGGEIVLFPLYFVPLIALMLYHLLLIGVQYHLLFLQ